MGKYLDYNGLTTFWSKLKSYFIPKLSSSTDNAIVRFDGTNSSIQDSLVTIDDDGSLAIPAGSSTTYANNPILRVGNACLTTNADGTGFGIGRINNNNITTRYVYDGSGFRPASGADNNYNLGTSDKRFKNLYIAGQIKDGTYSLTIPSKSGTIALTDDIVTSLSSSSTDNQVPSAKCVYDLVGDIETLLQAI